MLRSIRMAIAASLIVTAPAAVAAGITLYPPLDGKNDSQAELAIKMALWFGDLDTGMRTLEQLAAADDPEAWFGIGALKLAQTAEQLSQALYRHGFALPDTSNAILGPGARIPLQVNPNPEPLDYAGVRVMLSDFVTGMDEARAAFLSAAPAGDYVIDINPLLVRIDANGDGAIGDNESLGWLFALMSNVDIDELLAPPKDGSPQFEHIGFDRADAYWLAGYTQVLAGQADFLLAHDFSSFTDALFHRLFPKAGFPMQDYAEGGVLMMDPETDTAIADLVAGIHTLDWPVIEPARLAGVRERMKSVLDLSRQNWDAILEETDDDHELLPSPKQTAMIPGTSITEAKVAAWRVTLDQAQRVIDGELLIPHWRFRQGFDLRAYFETATETDLVMLLTGAGAIPFLRDGPVAQPQDFQQMEDAFGTDWLGYVFWFN
ncbi:MAG: hypothetical protein EOP22_15790 [Hyphomicrobiales bacterium]|nr:MAG: hypothetical protein EOP22_15790 [Hyphomicrobiales bacterium]